MYCFYKSSCGVGSISDTLKTSLCLSIPPFFSELVQKIISESIHVSNESQDDQGANVKYSRLHCMYYLQPCI